MKKIIRIVQIPPEKGTLCRLKKTAFWQFLKRVGWVKSLYQMCQELNLYRKFKKFDHGGEFREYICKLPFEFAELTNSGELNVCCYLPSHIGNIGNVNRAPFKKVWNSYISRKLRGSMLDGTFSYCDKKKCRSMQNFDSNLVKKSEVQDPVLKEIIQKSSVTLTQGLKVLSLANDYSCNLECPSCREGMKKMGEDEVVRQTALFYSIMEEAGPKLELIHIAGDGDPFASRFYESIITKTDWKKYPNLKIRFQTNGIALTEKKWKGLPSEVKNRVVCIGISIDGATSATYEKLRLGGNFDNLIKNIEYLATMPDRKTFGITLNLNMIVQEENYREMIPLVLIGKKLGVDTISFTYLRNWGTYSDSEYARYAIQLPDHPDHSKLLEILKDPLLLDSSVDLGNLVHVAPKSLCVTT